MDRLGALFAIVFAGALLYAAIDAFQGDDASPETTDPSSTTTEVADEAAPSREGRVPGF